MVSPARSHSLNRRSPVGDGGWGGLRSLTLHMSQLCTSQEGGGLGAPPWPPRPPPSRSSVCREASQGKAGHRAAQSPPQRPESNCGGWGWGQTPEAATTALSRLGVQRRAGEPRNGGVTLLGLHSQSDSGVYPRPSRPLWPGQPGLSQDPQGFWETGGVCRASGSSRACTPPESVCSGVGRDPSLKRSAQAAADGKEDTLRT